jgi:hypothetical protein
MRLRSFTKPYEMLPPVPEKETLTHGFAYQHGTFLQDIEFVHLLNEINIETLQAMYHDHPSRRARMRAHCILLSHQHYPIHDIVRFYQV